MIADLTDPLPREQRLTEHLKEVDSWRKVYARASGLKRAAAARQLADSLAAAFQEAFGLAACLSRNPKT